MTEGIVYVSFGVGAHFIKSTPENEWTSSAKTASKCRVHATDTAGK